MDSSDEDELLRSAALQTTRSILAARKRAKEQLVRAKEDLERRTPELEVLPGEEIPVRRWFVPCLLSGQR